MAWWEAVGAYEGRFVGGGWRVGHAPGAPGGGLVLCAGQRGTATGGRRHITARVAPSQVALAVVAVVEEEPLAALHWSAAAGAGAPVLAVAFGGDAALVVGAVAALDGLGERFASAGHAPILPPFPLVSW